MSHRAAALGAQFLGFPELRAASPGSRRRAWSGAALLMLPVDNDAARRRAGGGLPPRHPSYVSFIRLRA